MRNQVCESCGLPIRDGERLSLFQTHHEPFVICIRRLRAEVERLEAENRRWQYHAEYGEWPEDTANALEDHHETD